MCDRPAHAALCGPVCRAEAIGRQGAVEGLLRRMPHAQRSGTLRRALETERDWLRAAIVGYDQARR